MENQTIKEIAYTLGTDLCGVAPIDRFKKAPQGFHPTDIFPATKSVVMFAKRMPEGALHGSNGIPYTVVSDSIRDETVRIGWMLSLKIEETGPVHALPLPGDPYNYWNDKNLTGKGLLSFRHAGMLAGLGVMGKNTLLTNPQFGNRITLGAVLLDVEVEGDPLMSETVCKSDCTLCLDSCPVQAIADGTVNQKRCRTHSQKETPRGHHVYACNTCRRICPNGMGVK